MAEAGACQLWQHQGVVGGRASRDTCSVLVKGHGLLARRKHGGAHGLRSLELHATTNPH